jgi:spermidine synthase
MIARPTAPPIARVLFLSVFLIATCGLIYELIAGAISSYLLGDTITWFSLIIGVYLSAMGVGSYLSKHVEGNLVARFVEVELAVALLGGFEGPLLYAGFAYTPNFRPILFIIVGLIGMGVGLELPLLVRILEREASLKDLLARVLFLDYIGALAASLLFPLFLLPRLGLFQSSLTVGLVNAAVGLWTASVFQAPPRVKTRLRVLSLIAIALLGGTLLFARTLEERIEADLFADPIALRVQSPYQRIVVTRRDADLRLYIDGALQFSALDEHRYHEALVQVPLAHTATPARRVLVMGGGDGLALREVFRHDSVEAVTLVDLDPEMTRLFRDRPELATLNGGSLADPRVTIVNEDAFVWLRTYDGPRFDAAIIDFPDPNNHGLGKLYSRQFYAMLRRSLAEGATFSVQSTSPLFSRRAWSCIVETVGAAGLLVRPYHTYIPSFGEWGFVLGSKNPLPAPREFPAGLRFLNAELLPTLFTFPTDIAPLPSEVNRLDNQVLVRLYEEEWAELRVR